MSHASTATLVMTVGVPFAWWGAVVAISGLETPLKFRAPGVTVAQGVSIGRIVFKALNALEVALAVVVVVGLATASDPGATAWTLLVVVLAALTGQLLAVRPRLDRRAAALLSGEVLGRSRLHLVYVAGEAVKLIGLPVLAVVLAHRLH